MGLGFLFFSLLAKLWQIGECHYIEKDCEKYCVLMIISLQN